jgi:hypothetical protein
LGIEHEGFVSNPVWFSVEQYLESAKLVKWMCDRWGIPKDRNHIIAHGEKSNAQWVEWVKLNYPSMDPTCNTHTDPGPLWDWDFFIQMIRQDSTAPKVISQPPAGKIQVYDQISITFDQRMEKNSTEANFKISPSISGTFSWSNKYRTLTFKPDLNWDFATSYLIKIDTNAHNYMNISLDQNGDGKADIYSFTLQTVEKDTIPPVILTTYPRKGSNDISKSAEFVFTFSEPIDFSTLTQSFELKDENANSVGLTSPIATVVSGVCKVVVKPISFLKPQSSYTLTAKTFIKDFAGNALSAGKEIIFITEPTIALVGTVVEGFNSTGDWKQPSYSGSTQNVEAGFSIVTDVKVAGAGAGRISYSFLNPSGGRIREYNSSKPTAEGGTYYGIWVYGDNSGHTLEYWFYYSPGPFVIISIDTINWTGWKLKFIPTSQIPGTARTLAGIVINQVASGSRSGTLYFDEITVGNTITNVESSEKEMLPTSIVLEQNYPNPFNPSTAISYQLSAFNLVRLKIFDILGKEVADLVNAEQPPGRFTVVWNASLFPSGVYYCRMQVGDVVQTRKLLLVK